AGAGFLLKTSPSRGLSAVLSAPDESQARPDVVDGAHFVVDEAVGEADVAEAVLVEVGGDARGALGPRDPDAAVGPDRSGEAGEPALQLSGLGGEQEDDFGVAACAPAELHAVGQPVEFVLEPLGRAEEGDRVTGADAELL